MTFMLNLNEHVISPTHNIKMPTIVGNLTFMSRRNLSRVMRKPAFCICENKDSDQHLCFRYIDSIIPLVPKYEISSL